MWKRNRQSKPRQAAEIADPLMWTGLVLAALLSLALVIQTTSAISGLIIIIGEQAEIAAD